MSDWTLNGYPVLAGEITAPLTGRWVADLAVDVPEALTGAVELRVGGVRWAGAVVRGGVEADTAHVRVVGGTGGLDRTVLARSWQGLQPVRGLVQELLAEVGEVLDAGSGTELDANLPRWSRLDGPAHHALADLARAAGARWRLTIDGAVWIGTESWPELVLPDDVVPELLATNPRQGTATYRLPGAWVAPGQTFEGRRVGAVRYVLADRRDRLTVWWA